MEYWSVVKEEIPSLFKPLLQYSITPIVLRIRKSLKRVAFYLVIDS